MKNAQLPDHTTLLPGSAPFHSHPGYTAENCGIREVVRAQTYATNNGFRCGDTGGHCVPGEHCGVRRERAAEFDRKQAEFQTEDSHDRYTAHQA